MNKWQMSNAATSLTWNRSGGYAKDAEKKIHTSIHPNGRRR